MKKILEIAAVVATLITIFVFTTGIFSISEFFDNEEKHKNTPLNRVIGFEGKDYVVSSIRTSDGYVFGGITSKNNKNAGDMYLLKLDIKGDKLWEKIFSKDNSDEETITSITEVEDGGLVFVGNYYNEDASSIILMVKVDKEGNKVWEKQYGVNGDYNAFKIIQDSDKNLIFVGMAEREKKIEDELLIVKYNSEGTFIWEKLIGAEKFSYAGSSIIENELGNYIITGARDGWLFDDGIIIELNKTGRVLWNKAVDIGFESKIRDLVMSDDGNYILVGEAEIERKDKTIDKDFLIVKIHKNGKKIIWKIAFGGKRDDIASSLTKTQDGGFIVVGVTESIGNGETDIWIIKIDKNGKKIWEKNYGDTDYDYGYSVLETSNRDIIISGSTIIGAKNEDIWILRLNSKGELIK